MQWFQWKFKRPDDNSTYKQKQMQSPLDNHKLVMAAQEIEEFRYAFSLFDNGKGKITTGDLVI